MKAYWNCTKEQLEEMFGFREKGLTEEEVERIRKETGENRLSEGRHKSLLQVFLSQFCDLMVIILIIAAIISMFSGNTESTIVIFLVLLMNAVLGTIQYRKAEKSLDSFKDLAAPAGPGYPGWKTSGDCIQRDCARGLCNLRSRGHDCGRRKNSSQLFPAGQ